MSVPHFERLKRHSSKHKIIIFAYIYLLADSSQMNNPMFKRRYFV